MAELTAQLRMNTFCLLVVTILTWTLPLIPPSDSTKVALCWVSVKKEKKSSANMKITPAFSVPQFTEMVVRTLKSWTLLINVKSTEINNHFQLRKFLTPGALLPFHGVASSKRAGKRRRSLPEKCGECWTWRTDRDAAALVQKSSQSYEAAHTRLCLLSLWRGKVNREGGDGETGWERSVRGREKSGW